MGSTLVMGDKLHQAGYGYYQVCQETLGGRIPWLDYFVLNCTELPLFRPLFSTVFQSADEFASAILATSYVPGFMGLRPWIFFNGHRLFDGYISALQAAFPTNYMYVSFLPTAPQWIFRARHVLQVHEMDTTTSSLFVKAWPWGDPIWADHSYDRGRSDAIANRE